MAASIVLAPLAYAQSAGGAQRDCDDNAILRCGAYSSQEMNEKYNSQAGAKAIFSVFGITDSQMSQLHSTAVSGYITKGGRVLVNGETVAEGAITAGRQNMPGSEAVKLGNDTFYLRPPSASFNQDKLDAYVVMSGGRFQYAIIKSCGNPVKATPVEKPQSVQPPPPVQPAVSSGECRLINLTTGQNRQVSVTVNSGTVNAQVTGYTIDFGDGTGSVNVGPGNTSTATAATANVTAGTTQTVASTSQAIMHAYAQDGTYTITGSVQVRYPDGRTETKTSDTCRVPITFAPPMVPVGKTETPPPAAPRQPLPATGAGDVLGAAAAISAASTVGYLLYGWLRSRLYSL